MHEPMEDISHSSHNNQTKVQLGCFLMGKGRNKVWILGRAVFLEKGRGVWDEGGVSWHTGRWGEMRGRRAAGKSLRDTVPAYWDEGFNFYKFRRVTHR